MAVRLLNCFGPRVADPAAYNLTAGWSCINTGAASSAIQGTGTTLVGCEVGPSVPFNAASGENSWVLAVRTLSVNTALTAGQVVPLIGWEMSDFGHPHELVAVGDASGGWRLRLRDLTLSTLYDDDTLYATDANAWVVVQLGQGGARLWVDRQIVWEGPASPWPDLTGVLLLPHGAFGTPVTKSIGRLIMAAIDDPFSVPDPGSIAMAPMHPNTNPAAYSDAGSHAGCADPSLGSFAHWDDWNAGGSADDDTTFNCLPPPAGVVKREASGTANPVFAAGQIPRGVRASARLRATGASKGMAPALLAYDGSTLVDYILTSSVPSSYAVFGVILPTPPGGGEWDQAKCDSLQVGIERQASDASTDDLRITALGVEAAAWTTLQQAHIEQVPPRSQDRFASVPVEATGRVEIGRVRA